MILLAGVFAVGLVLSAYPALLLPIPPLTADSASYLGFAPFRTAGYPLFLKLTGVQGALVLQPLLFAGALTYFTYETCRLTGSGLFAALLALAMMINPEFNKFHAVVMTESLVASLLVVFIAGTMRLARCPDWPAALTMSAAAGLSATIRPSGLALVPVIVLMLIMMRQRVPSIILAAVVPALVLVAAERGLTTWEHGAAASSLAGRHFYAKAAMIPGSALAPGDDQVQRSLVRALDERFAPVRALIGAAPTADIARTLLLNYEACAEYACSEDLRAQSGLSEAALDATMLRIALERISGAPAAYARLTWMHVRSMWVLYSQSHPALAPAYALFIAAHRPLPFETKMPALVDPSTAGWRAIVARPVFTAFGVATGLLALIGFVAASVGCVDRVGSVALLAALSVHMTLLLTALAGVGIVRYMLTEWPAIVTALGMSAWWLFNALPMRRPLSGPPNRPRS